MNHKKNNRGSRPAALFVLLVMLSMLAASAWGQDGKADLDRYYSFPFSVGSGYRSLQAFSGFASGFAVREFGAELRAPLKPVPTLQPLLRLGTANWLQAGSAGSGQFDHDEWFASLGLSFSTRFSRNFEIGIEGSGGVSQTYFSNLSPGSVVGSAGFIADAGMRIGLVPSYNVAVDVAPGIRWSQTTGQLTEFDGLSFGVGFSVSYRFGQDPDSAAALIRALRLSTGKLPPVFAAMQSYYAAKPFATITLTNDEKAELTDIEVAFFQPGYMDAPTPVAGIASIPAKGSVDVGLLAAFNQEVFRTEGTTPLAGELSVRYRFRGRPVEQRFPLSYELLDRTAIVWDDDRKVGAFITPADSALRNYASYIRQSLKSENLTQLNEPLQTAAQVYAALDRLGLLYQADPSSPFIKAQDGPASLDSVSLGRSTLVRGSGDCDDLTVLFASLLESVGIETGFITVPGHIYPAFNTKLQARDYKDLYPDRGLSFVVNDQLWIPIEITLVGKQSFLDAWRRGAELWRLYDADVAKRAFYRTADAQALYRPVALRESDLGLQYGSKEELTAIYRRDFAGFSNAALAELSTAASKSGDKKDWNILGIAYVRYGKLKEAEAAFQRALKIDPAFTNTQVNLGNIAYMQKEYRKAISVYQSAMKSLELQGRGASVSAQMVLVNTSLAYNAISDFTNAKTVFEKAVAINADRVRDFAYLASVGAGTSGAGTSGAGTSGAGTSGAGKASEQSETVLYLKDE